MVIRNHFFRLNLLNIYGYIQQLTCITSISPITKYLDSYCTDNDESLAFSKKVVLENEVKLTEFNFKILHGIFACNKNLKKWKLRLDDRCLQSNSN